MPLSLLAEHGVPEQVVPEQVVPSSFCLISESSQGIEPQPGPSVVCQEEAIVSPNEAAAKDAT